MTRFASFPAGIVTWLNSSGNVAGGVVVGVRREQGTKMEGQSWRSRTGILDCCSNNKLDLCLPPQLRLLMPMTTASTTIAKAGLAVSKREQTYRKHRQRGGIQP